MSVKFNWYDPAINGAFLRICKQQNDFLPLRNLNVPKTRWLVVSLTSLS